MAGNIIQVNVEDVHLKNVTTFHSGPGKSVRSSCYCGILRFPCWDEVCTIL